MTADSVDLLLEALVIRHQTWTAANARFASRVAPNFSSFAAFDPNEATLSKLIRDMLDPKGSHAQGDLFLRLFLEQIGLEWPSAATRDAHVQTERFVHSQPRTLVDVFVEGFADRAMFHLAIESKLRGAVDQPRQIARYFEAIERMEAGSFKPRCEQTRVVYLTIDSADPSLGSFPEADQTADRMERLTCMNAADLADWLERCRCQAKAPAVAAHAAAFHTYIQTQLIGVEESVMSEITDTITESPERVHAFFQSLACEDTVRQQLGLRFQRGLRDALEKHSLELEPSAGKFEPWNIGIRCIGASDCPVVKLLGPNWKLTWMLFGLHDPEKKFAANAEAISRTLKERVGRSHVEEPYDGGRSNNWRSGEWIWVQLLGQPNGFLALPENWDASPDIWRMMASGELAPMIADAAKKLFGFIGDLDGENALVSGR